MSTLAQIRDGLQATLQANITGLQVYDTIEDVVETPAAVIGLRPGTEIRPAVKFDQAFNRGLHEYFVELHLFVTHREGGYSQKDLDQYISSSGPKSIASIIWHNPTLGLPDTDAFAESVINYNGQASVAKIQHVGATVILCVRTSGS